MRGDAVSSRGAIALVLVLAVVLLAGCGDGSGPEREVPQSDESAADPTGRLDTGVASMEQVEAAGSATPPCSHNGGSNDPCEQRAVSSLNLFSMPIGGAASTPAEGSTVEDVLEKGLRLAESSPVHLAFRGTTSAGSVRCDWRGIARTPDQREETIRYWLDLDEDVVLPAASVLETLFMSILDSRNLERPMTTLQVLSYRQHLL